MCVNLLMFLLLGIIRKIHRSLYEPYLDIVFGDQEVWNIQLCAMTDAKDKSGYYNVIHSVPIKGVYLTGYPVFCKILFTIFLWAREGSFGL